MNPRAPSLRRSPLGELLTGSCFSAHPTDITAPLSRRFAGRSLLAIHVALEKAATVRVSFNEQGCPALSGIRHIRQRSGPEFAEALRAEVAATGVEWAVVIWATGWQAVLGQRAARSEQGESPFARYRLLFETPEAVVPRAQSDRIYTAIDHPSLDKSIVFSLRRSEVETTFAEVRRSGLQVASARIALAAQLEAWLATEGEQGLGRDLLLSDGLTALLINVEHGDFVLPPSASEAEQPRQSVQRPGAVEGDIARFLDANGKRSVVFIGPEDLFAALQPRRGSILHRAAGHPAHDTQQASLHDSARHDLCFEARELRPALPVRWRKALWAYAALLVVLLALAATNGIYAARTRLGVYQAERDAAAARAQLAADQDGILGLGAEAAEAAAMRGWVAGNFHAQSFCYRLLREVPATAAIEKLQLEMKQGQMALSFVVLGDAEAQLATRRALEKAITELRYKIGGEDAPVLVAGSNRGVQYRLHLIAPDAGEVGA